MTGCDCNTAVFILVTFGIIKKVQTLLTAMTYNMANVFNFLSQSRGWCNCYLVSCNWCGIIFN